MEFCTAVNCMDGRAQIPVIRFLQQRFGVSYVDTVTEAGPNRILADRTDELLVASVLERIDVSVERHDSQGIAVAGHHDCAGNPAEKEEQLEHLEKSLRFLRDRYPKVEVIALWVNEAWQVEELE